MQKSSFPSAGTQRGLMILADFKYMKHKVPAVKFHDIMNMRNYNNTGFFKEFYLENSYGQFYITTDIVKWAYDDYVWVTLPRNHTYCARNGGVYDQD